MYSMDREISEERVGPCPGCLGFGLDRACAGHPVGPATVRSCGCPVCGGEDLAVTLSHSDLATFAAD